MHFGHCWICSHPVYPVPCPLCVLTPMVQLDPLCATVLDLRPPATTRNFSLRSVLSSHSLAAVNTFIDGAPTWTDVAVPAALVPMVKECYVDQNTNLSPMVRGDHCCGCPSLSPSCPPTCRSSPGAPPLWVLEDPVNVSRFQWLLQYSVFDPKIARWTKTVITAQRQACPVPRGRSLMRRWKHWSRFFFFSTNVWLTLWRLSARHRACVGIDVLLAPALNLFHYAHLHCGKTNCSDVTANAHWNSLLIVKQRLQPARTFV